MDINDSLKPFIDLITADIMSKVNSTLDTKIADLINKKIDGIGVEQKIDAVINTEIESVITRYKPDTNIINQQIVKASSTIIDNVTKQVKADINEKLSQLDVQSAVKTYVDAYLTGKINNIEFPPRSINGTAIDPDTLTVTGNSIKGGIIENFGSTGIEDKATSCKVTILDDFTVFENNLLASSLTVKGTTTIEGDLVVTGDIPIASPAFKNLIVHCANQVQENLNNELFTGYSDIVIDRIRREGLDLSTFKLGGREILDGRQLSSFVTESNLQKLGLLKELQVQGEALLSDSLYTGKNRVGVNTIEPSAALAVWDEEIEVTVSKRQKDVAAISTPRAQKLVLSSNNKDNLTVNPDGTVAVNTLTIGTMNFSSAEAAPGYEAAKGTVVFNSNPSLGGPMGWISLGSARWANFGIID